jgi:hypothetical protein
VVDLLADAAVVDLPRSSHDVVGERRHPGRGDVVFDLGGVLSARDGAGDGGVHEDPTQRELREGVSFGYEFLEFLGGQKAGLEVYSGERLAPVEGLPFAVEVAVVVFAKLAVVCSIAGSFRSSTRSIS